VVLWFGLKSFSVGSYYGQSIDRMNTGLYTTTIESTGFLTMVYNTQNYWIFGLYPSSGIPIQKIQHFGNWICFCRQVRERRHLLC
jgi:hypothetical protein